MEPKTLLDTDVLSGLMRKNEGMIKLPVDLESRGDWLEVLAATVQRRCELLQ